MGSRDAGRWGLISGWDDAELWGSFMERSSGRLIRGIGEGIPGGRYRVNRVIVMRISIALSACRVLF